jgi:hypothetical protein
VREDAELIVERHVGEVEVQDEQTAASISRVAGHRH